MKKNFYIICILCLFFISACTPKEKKGYAPPAVIPQTTREMKSPGFWVSRHPFADKVILDSSGIDLLNSKTEKKLLIEDIAKIGPVYAGSKLSSLLRKTLNDLSPEKLFDKNAKRISKLFGEAIQENINFSEIPQEIKVHYGFVSRYADQRILPTDDMVVSRPGDVEFDELQNSSLDIGTPLAILHDSKDGVWVYTHAPTSSGWIKKINVVVCSLDDLKSYLAESPFVVVISPKADIFLDPALTEYFDYVRMGAQFPAKIDINSKIVQISIPVQAKDGMLAFRPAYTKQEDVNFGYLSYTSRNIIEQAFKLLNAPYGWGGVNGEQDCSSFLQEVFATVGINLPRNSSDQGKVGKPWGTFTEKTSSVFKREALNALAVGGTTILQLKGHVLLYLGTYEGVPYAIHETHGYRQKVWHGEILRAVNRVIVSDLTLGQGTKKGSLLERLLSIRGID